MTPARKRAAIMIAISVPLWIAFLHMAGLLWPVLKLAGGVFVILAAAGLLLLPLLLRNAPLGEEDERGFRVVE